ISGVVLGDHTADQPTVGQQQVTFHPGPRRGRRGLSTRRRLVGDGSDPTAQHRAGRDHEPLNKRRPYFFRHLARTFSPPGGSASARRRCWRNGENPRKWWRNGREGPRIRQGEFGPRARSVVRRSFSRAGSLPTMSRTPSPLFDGMIGQVVVVDLASSYV